MPRQFRTKNLSVSLNPSSKLGQLTEKLRICVLNTHVCLGWTNCRLLTHYCHTYISWCRLFTCRIVSVIGCGHPNSWVACELATQPTLPCAAATGVLNPGDILVDPEIYVRQIAELRADLQEAIRQLDAHEKDIGNVTKEG